MSTPPGLVIGTDPHDPRSYAVFHARSPLVVIYGCAGVWTADSAARDVAHLLDWTMSAKRILTVLEAFPELIPEMERIAARWGGSLYPKAPADEYPFRVSA